MRWGLQKAWLPLNQHTDHTQEAAIIYLCSRRISSLRNVVARGCSAPHVINYQEQAFTHNLAARSGPGILRSTCGAGSPTTWLTISGLSANGAWKSRPWVLRMHGPHEGQLVRQRGGRPWQSAPQQTFRPVDWPQEVMQERALCMTDFPVDKALPCRYHATLIRTRQGSQQEERPDVRVPGRLACSRIIGGRYCRKCHLPPHPPKTELPVKATCLKDRARKRS